MLDSLVVIRDALGGQHSVSRRWPASPPPHVVGRAQRCPAFCHHHHQSHRPCPGCTGDQPAFAALPHLTHQSSGWLGGGWAALATPMPASPTHTQPCLVGYSGQERDKGVAGSPAFCHVHTSHPCLAQQACGPVCSSRLLQADTCACLLCRMVAGKRLSLPCSPLTGPVQPSRQQHCCPLHRGAMPGCARPWQPDVSVRLRHRLLMFIFLQSHHCSCCCCIRAGCFLSAIASWPLQVAGVLGPARGPLQALQVKPSCVWPQLADS